MAYILVNCLLFCLVVLRPSIGMADETSPQLDPAPPQFFPKPDNLQQPSPVKHPLGNCSGKPRSLTKECITSDWQCFLGPSHDGISPETGLKDHLDPPPDGSSFPVPLWSVAKGESYSAPSIKDNLLILFHCRENHETVECLDAGNGDLFWSYRYPTTYRDKFNYLNGPRASPAIDDDLVYTCGAQGMFHCFDLKTGHLYWQRNLLKEFEADEGFFGFTPSPIIEKDMLILNLGGKRGGSVAAFDKYKGTLKWLSDDKWDRSYATPIVATMYNKRILLAFAGGMSDPPVGGLLALDPESGRIHFRQPWRSPRYFSANASSPVVSGNRVFVSSSYDIYGAMIEVQPDLTNKLVYKTRNYASHWMTPILRDGYLYGFFNNILVCMEWQTGNLAWKQTVKLGGNSSEPAAQESSSGRKFGAEQYREPPGKQGFGFGSLLWADNHFICLGETGLLAWLDLSPKGCRIIYSCRLFSADQTWTAPVLSKGLLYINQNLPDQDNPPRLLCYDIRAKTL
jgi:outer membrane protein assembly factor BamB